MSRALPFQSPDIALAFDAYPPAIKAQADDASPDDLRRGRSDGGSRCARGNAQVGRARIRHGLEQERKYRPHYLEKSRPTQYAMYFHCQTNLVDRFRGWFPNDFTFEGDRALIFEAGEPIPVEALTACIIAALTYHRDKPRSAHAAATRHGG